MASPRTAPRWRATTGPAGVRLTLVGAPCPLTIRRLVHCGIRLRIGAFGFIESFGQCQFVISPMPRLTNDSNRQSTRAGVYPERMVPAHRVIPGVLAQIIRPAPLCAEKVEFAWRTSVGPAVSRSTRVRLDAGVLVVTAQDAQWRRE